MNVDQKSQSRPGKWSKLRSLSARQWNVLMRTPFVLALTAWRLKKSGYAATMAQFSTRTVDQNALNKVDDVNGDSLSGPSASEIAYAVAVAIKYGPWKPRCLTHSVSLAYFLSAEEIPYTIRFGLPERGDHNQDETREFSAHAWLESEGRVLTDNESVAERFLPFDNRV